MAKDPAFLFYVNDFDCGTKFFTHEQLGKYLRLLIAQFQHGALSEKQVLFICKDYDEDIMMKFTKDEKGNYYNARLTEEINKRNKFSESRSNNRKGKKNKEVNHISSTYVDTSVKHMENENENVNDNIIINKSKKFHFSDFNGLPSHFIETAQRQIKSFQDVSVTPDKVAEIWEIFKMQNLLGDKHYNSENDVYKHFISWIKFSKLDKPKQNETRDRGQDILNWLNSTK